MVHIKTQSRSGKKSHQDLYFSWNFPQSPSVQDPIWHSCSKGTQWDGLEWFLRDEWIPCDTFSDPNTQSKSPLYCYTQLPLHPPPSKHTESICNKKGRKWLRKAARETRVRDWRSRQNCSQIQSESEESGQTRWDREGQWVGWAHCTLKSLHRGDSMEWASPLATFPFVILLFPWNH